MLRQITANLGQGFHIIASEDRSNIKIQLLKDRDIIGESSLITDHVDVSCVSHIHLNDEFVHYKIRDAIELGEIFIKFNLKFPTIVRKLEFSFFLNIPPNLQEIISKHHFDQGEDSNLKNEIMLCHNIIYPVRKKLSETVHIKKSVAAVNLEKLLSFLQKGAYWQSHLTLDRLKILTSNSTCFYAFSDTNELIGFCRVLTDDHSFASLWDVVVEESYRKKGIGTELMFAVFTDEKLSTVNNWVIYTDTAKQFYQKFGFIQESDVPSRTLMHKLRLQESHPTYMSHLIQFIPKDQHIHLDEQTTLKFLFGEQGKRANLSDFWKQIPVVDEKKIQNDSNYSYRY